MLKDAIRKFPKIYQFLSESKRWILRLGRVFWPYRLRNYPEKMGFHGDPVLRYLVFNIKEWFSISSCVETGVFKGDTALFLAKIFPDIFRYSIELNNEYFKEASWRLLKFKKSLIIKNNSPAGIADLIKESKLGELPLFFLDAHWYEYWPLSDELKEISKLNKAIIIIDDFEVPGRPEYGFDTYKSGKSGEKDLPNNFDFISISLRTKNYHYLLPKYKAEEVFPENPESLRGYVVIFQNFSENELEKVMNSNLVKEKYTAEALKAR